MSEISLTIKCSNADKVIVSISPSASVLELKEKISEALSVPATSQRLIYKGRVLKDDLGLDFYQVQHEHTVHMVKGGGASSGASPAAPTAAPAPAPVSGSSAFPAAPAAPMNAYNPYNMGTPNPFGGLPGAAQASQGFGAFPGMGQGMDVNRMQEQLMRNPEVMQQILDSPMMANLMNNPDLLRNTMLNNPQMQQMLDANPQMRHVLNDPATLRQAMEMMRNPNAMQAAMRSQDLAMSQLENMPGGFDAMRRMYEDMEPLQQDAQQAQAQGQSAQQAQQQATPVGANPTNNAVPNPWGPRPAAAAAAPFGAPFGAPMGMPGMGMGAMGMPGMPPMDAGMMAAMNNPAMMQMMTQMMNDPAMVAQMSAMNPQLGQALADPATRAMLTNPEVLQAMMQMQTSMATLQNAGVMPRGMPGMPGAMGMGAMGQQQGMGLNFNSLLQPQGFGAQGLQGFQGFAPQAPAAPVAAVDPAVRYASALQQLADMGFGDQAACLRALTATGGNVNAAVERLLGGN